MLLAIDIGNTNISLAVFKGASLLKRAVLPTSAKSYKHILKKLIGRNDMQVVVCSVVPDATVRLRQELKRLGVKAYIIGKEIKVPIKNLYRKPGQVGQDRLVNAYSGVRLYGAPLVAVDFGTAITFDSISASGAYLGGMILPGLGISLDSLASRTALLPKIKLQPPREFIGKDTQSSILSGVVFGYAALVDELCARLKQKLGRRAKVVLTGGNARFMAKFCRNFDQVDPDLILKGLMLLGKNYKKNS